VPGIKLYQQQIAAVNKSDTGNELALLGWVDGWGAMQIIGSIKSGPITSQTILSAMKTATVSFDGVAPDWHYEYNTLGLGCVTNNTGYEGEYEGGTSVTPLNGDKPVTALSSGIISFYKNAFASYDK